VADFNSLETIRDTESATENQGVAGSVVPDLVIDCREVTFPKRNRVVWSQPKPKFTWLYVIECEAYSKIGLATSPAARLATLTGACPLDIVLFNAYRVPMALARLSEAWCHRKLSGLHHRAEWFSVAPEEAIKLVQAVADLACRARRAKTRPLYQPEECRRLYALGAPKTIRYPDKPVWEPIRGEPEWIEAQKACQPPVSKPVDKMEHA
jgi:hypothetical protein